MRNPLLRRQPRYRQAGALFQQSLEQAKHRLGVLDVRGAAAGGVAVLDPPRDGSVRPIEPARQVRNAEVALAQDNLQALLELLHLKKLSKAASTAAGVGVGVAMPNGAGAGSARKGAAC